MRSITLTKKNGCDGVGNRTRETGELPGSELVRYVRNAMRLSLRRPACKTRLVPHDFVWMAETEEVFGAAKRLSSGVRSYGVMEARCRQLLLIGE